MVFFLDACRIINLSISHCKKSQVLILYLSVAHTAEFLVVAWLYCIKISLGFLQSFKINKDSLCDKIHSS